MGALHLPLLIGHLQPVAWTLLLLYHTSLSAKWSEFQLHTRIVGGSTSGPAAVLGLFLTLIGAVPCGAASFALICWGSKLRDVWWEIPFQHLLTP